MRGLSFNLFLVGWLLAVPSFAANHYIRDGGSGDGSAWNNALDDLPASLTRGDTYYIADGNYAAYTFNDAASGTDYITIKKATVADHGTETGWDNAYGDGQAVWSGSGAFVWYITTSYWIFDGVTGGGPDAWDTGHGFKLSLTPNDNIIVATDFNSGVGNLFFHHIEAEAGTNVGPPYATGIYLITHGSNLALSYCYVHDVAGDMYQTRGLKNFTNEYSKFSRNFQDATRHGDLIENDGASTNHTFRWNFVEDCVGTYLLGHHNDGDFDGYYIYGNAFWWSTNFSGTTDNGSIATLSSGTGKLLNCRIYNNTFANIINGGEGVAQNASINLQIAGSTGYVSNNIFAFKNGHDVTFTYPATVAHDYNAYLYDSNSVSEASIQTLTSIPFVSITTRNLQLTANTDAGVNLGAPYNTDPTGATRTTWTRGVFEFEGSPPPAGITWNATVMNAVTINVGQ